MWKSALVLSGAIVLTLAPARAHAWGSPRHGFGIGLGFTLLGLKPSLFTSALGAQLTWTLPFGMFAMFAVVNRFNRSYEEAASDLGASSWQRLRYVTLPILLPGIIGVGMGAFTLSYDEYARTTLVIGPKNTLPLEIYALISSATSPTGHLLVDYRVIR
jgi:putative spermidine/putrescine transport system permease protein